MTGRTWLVVIPAVPGPLRERDWFAELRPLPDELVLHDRIAIVSWPDQGLDRWPVVAGTAAVTKLSREDRVLRLRHRVWSVPGHEVAIASFGTRLVAARGWSGRRRGELLGAPSLVSERDFELVEAALLDIAHTFGPAPKRPAHHRPRTPGRRALVANLPSFRAPPARPTAGSGAANPRGARTPHR